MATIPPQIGVYGREFPTSIIQDGPSTTTMQTYEHATKLYLGDNYKNVPKFGHMYVVKFNVNKNIPQLPTWDSRLPALLAKEVVLPKFKITTDTLNQYNRKTNVQTKLNYDPVSISFHDDVGGSANAFWINYYKYFYQDSNYGDQSGSAGVRSTFADTKFGVNDYLYGFNPQVRGSKSPYFLDSIDIYLLHRGPGHEDYTQFTLINPLITAWAHDQIAQDNSKPLRNKMDLVYEDVIYTTGKMTSNGPNGIDLFDSATYDNSQSPIDGQSVSNGSPAKINFLSGKESPLNDLTQIIPPYQQYEPAPRQQQKAGLSLGSIINDINIIKSFKNNPRAAWNVYGINLNNMLKSGLVGAISTNPANIVNAAGIQNGQGTLAASPYNPNANLPTGSGTVTSIKQVGLFDN